MDVAMRLMKRFFPDVDERAGWLIVALGGFAILARKEVVLPQWLVVLAGLAGLALVLTAWRGKPEMPLYLLVAYLPFSYLLGGLTATRAAGTNLPNILMALTLIAYVSRSLREGRRVFESTPVHYGILLFVGMAAASFLASGLAYGGWYLAERLRSFLQWFKPIGLFFLAFWVVRDRRTFHTVLGVIMVAVTVVGVLAMWEALDRSGSSFDHSRVRGIAKHPNMLAAFFVTYMFLFLGRALAAPKSIHALMVLPFLLCVRGMMVTFSRGGYLGVAAGGLVASWLRHKALFFAVGAYMVAAAFHPALLPSGIRYRIGMTLAKQAPTQATADVTQYLETSASRRVSIWGAAIEMVRAHPWRGVGFGEFPEFAPHVSQGKVGYVDTHNAYLYLAAQMGLPTLLAFLALLGTIGYYAHWLYRHSAEALFKTVALGVLSGMAALMVANLFSTTINTEETTGYFWVLCGLLMRAVRLEQTQGRNAEFGMRNAESLDDTLRTPNSALRIACDVETPQPPVTLVHVIDNLGLGGAQRQLVELLKGLPRDRYACSVISLSTEKLDYAGAIRELGIPLTLIHQEGLWSWRTLAQVRRAIRAAQPTLVQTWLFTSDLYGRLAAWRERVPVILSTIRSVEPQKPRRRIWADRLLRHVTDRFIVNAQAVGEVARRREWVDPARLRVIYNGVDLAQFDPAQHDGVLRRTLGCGAEQPLIGIIGRLEPVKDHETLLRAAALVRRELPMCRFVCIGSGSLAPVLQGMVRRLALESSVQFLDSTRSLASAYASLDALVLTSRYEGCSNVILEAMAMAKPVIATAVGGNPELVQPGRTGLLVPAGDPEALAQAVLQLVRDREAMRRMGEAARQRVEAEFSLERMVRETDALYQQLFATRFKTLRNAEFGVRNAESSDDLLRTRNSELRTAYDVETDCGGEGGGRDGTV